MEPLETMKKNEVLIDSITDEVEDLQKNWHDLEKVRSRLFIILCSFLLFVTLSMSY